MRSATRTLAVTCAFITALSTHGNAGEVWRCSIKAPLSKFPNTDYELDILDKTENANVFWQKPGRFIIWKIPGADLLETYRISKDSRANLKALQDNDAVHAEMTLDKRTMRIRIAAGPAGGDVRFIQKGSCVPPSH